MKRIIQGLMLMLATYGVGGYGMGTAPETVLWDAYAQMKMGAYAHAEEDIAVYADADEQHPLIIEAKREAPPPPPPARLFVSAEGRYAIQRGWLAGAGYEENRVATHGEAVAMIMQLAALQPEEISTPDLATASLYGIIELEPDGTFDADAPLTHQDFAVYLGRVFFLPDMYAESIGTRRPRDIPFPDENDDLFTHEAYAAICTFLDHGVLDLDTSGNFNPERGVTLVEMARAAYRLRGLNPHS